MPDLAQTLAAALSGLSPLGRGDLMSSAVYQSRAPMVSSRKRIHSVNTHAGNPNAITQATLNGLTRLAGSGNTGMHGCGSCTWLFCLDFLVTIDFKASHLL